MARDSASLDRTQFDFHHAYGCAIQSDNSSPGQCKCITAGTPRFNVDSVFQHSWKTSGEKWNPDGKVALSTQFDIPLVRHFEAQRSRSSGRLNSSSLASTTGPHRRPSQMTQFPRAGQSSACLRVLLAALVSSGLTRSGPTSRADRVVKTPGSVPNLAHWVRVSPLGLTIIRSHCGHKHLRRHKQAHGCQAGPSFSCLSFRPSPSRQSPTPLANNNS